MDDRIQCGGDVEIFLCLDHMAREATDRVKADPACICRAAASGHRVKERVASPRRNRPNDTTHRDQILTVGFFVESEVNGLAFKSALQVFIDNTHQRIILPRPHHLNKAHDIFRRQQGRDRVHLVDNRALFTLKKLGNKLLTGGRVVAESGRALVKAGSLRLCNRAEIRVLGILPNFIEQTALPALAKRVNDKRFTSERRQILFWQTLASHSRRDHCDAGQSEAPRH